MYLYIKELYEYQVNNLDAQMQALGTVKRYKQDAFQGRIMEQVEKEIVHLSGEKVKRWTRWQILKAKNTEPQPSMPRLNLHRLLSPKADGNFPPKLNLMGQH